MKWAWGDRPRGLLVTTLRDHTACVNAIVVAQDHSFFASASDDGTLRLWPSSCLGKLEVYPSTHTVYSTQTGRLRCLVMLDGTRSLACGSSDGSVRVLKVRYSVARLVPCQLWTCRVVGGWVAIERAACRVEEVLTLRMAWV